jgi:hypothetical protein
MMRRWIFIIVVMICCTTVVTSCQNDPGTVDNSKLQEVIDPRAYLPFRFQLQDYNDAITTQALVVQPDEESLTGRAGVRLGTVTAYALQFASADARDEYYDDYREILEEEIPEPHETPTPKPSYEYPGTVESLDVTSLGERAYGTITRFHNPAGEEFWPSGTHTSILLFQRCGVIFVVDVYDDNPSENNLAAWEYALQVDMKAQSDICIEKP